ncbi:hypothetical protein EB151_10815, partial [archaeon]|nr:hypothetical protein [archaeon]
HMPVQTQSITYTKTRIMSSAESNAQNILPDNGWRFVDNDSTNGFVIKIKPSHPRSKILLNLSCHVGFDSIPESRWWGLKLYRKIEGGNWTEVTDANGSYVEGFSSCWLSHNMGANLSAYENFITNVSGSFFDEPFKGISTTAKNVYYTIKWKSNLGTYNANTGGGELYFNRPAILLDTSNSPVLSSTWTAQEVWQLGTPYIPSNASNIITIYNQDYVGIGNTEPQHTLDIDGNINITGDYLLNGFDAFADTSNYIKDIDNELTLRIDTTNAEIITTSNILFLKSSNFDAHTSNYVARIDGEVNARIDTTDANLVTTNNNITNIESDIVTTSNSLKSDIVNLNDKIFTASDIIKTTVIPIASAGTLGGIKIDNDTITIDEFGVISGSQNVDLSDYATKSYVDGIATGLVFKDSVSVATTANITLSSTQIIDGVSVVAGDRVLVKDQTTLTQNGIYLCASGSWTRTTDFDDGSEVKGAFVFVDSGDINGGSSFVCSNDSASITIGTTDINFSKFTSSGQLNP